MQQKNSSVAVALLGGPKKFNKLKSSFAFLSNFAVRITTLV